MRILLLTTDAYGGHGGIGLYNRDVVDALASLPDVREVVVVQRTMPFEPVGVPDKVRLVRGSVGGKLRYLRAALGAARGRYDLVICGHVHLLALAVALKPLLRTPLALMVYGVDVWTPPPWLSRHCLGAVDAFWSISEVTRDRMMAWSGLPATRFTLLPNAIHLDRYGEGERPVALARRHGLEGRRVLLTLARLPSFERYKGIDEILQVLPSLRQAMPDLHYMVVGEGSDRPRLEARRDALGLRGHVTFTGLVPEGEKADYFRLADVFAMPGRGEGFGFVFLEALACGVPVVGSRVDGSREALLDGELGELVDPADPGSVEAGILRAFTRPRGVPAGLAHFSFPRFRERLQRAVQSLLTPEARA